MSLQYHLRSPLVAFLHDLLMVPLAWFAAYWLRANLSAIPAVYLEGAWYWLPLIVAVHAGVFVYFGLYRGDWRFASLPDLLRILKAVVAGTLICVAIIFLTTRLHNIPRSIFPTYAMFLVGLLGAPRLFYRWFKDRQLYVGTAKRVLVAGAGRAGEMLVRDLARDPQYTLHPVGYVDDDPRKRGVDIHGIRVLGTTDQIPRLVEEHNVELILLAVPSARSRELRRIVEYCEQAAVPFRTLPCMQDLVDGRVNIEALRDVSIEDLLGRDTVRLDRQAISAASAGKCILISGGGGSIGSELCRQVMKQAPSKLVLLEKSEFNLYRIDRELRQRFPGIEIQTILGDVTDEVVVENLFLTHRPALVYHAAAYKHVPMLESQLRAAILNNVLGTRVLALAADRHDCDAFVLISTDKAVNPANVMGASKRIAEIFCQNLNRRSGTRYITVRFGNVLGSDGSVVPVFRSQIAAGGPVTVTHPDMTRYFMTIPEACQLILQAEAMGTGSEIYVLDMGEPVKITYLAEQMIRLSGHEPGRDIEIVYTGLRPGEKLFEELFHEKEHLIGTGHEKIFLANHRHLEWDFLVKIIAAMEAACERYDEKAIMEGVCKLVPELHHDHKELPDNVVRFDIDQKRNA